VYQDTAGDEVEDLAALLAFVQAALPGVQAVSCGAIASDYQRTRVERVCARLGLVSLAFMWNQPQARLLRDMIQAPVHAVLVKVAAAGLRPDRHLGAPLAALAPALHALRRRFGINVCGEGGEYETLTLDCPLFTRGRLVLDAWQAVVTSNDAVAPVALLHPTAFHVEPKGRSSAEAGAGAGEVIEVPDDYQPPAAAGGSAQDDAALDAAAAATAVDVELRVAGGGACLSVAASVAGDAADFGSPGGTAAAMAAALRAVDGALPGLGVGWGDSLFVHLYVPSMAQFAAANAAYARFLPAVNPPARATVQLAGGGGAAMVVEVLLGR
jgi:diphthine-ammonia ligase